MLTISENPIVTIITPMYNGASHIVNAIDSVQAQSLSNWRMIIIDDASTDDSILIVKEKILTDNRILLLKNSINRGSGYSRNMGLKMVTTQFVAFLDCDDTWFSNKLEVQIDLMVKNKFYFTYTGYQIISNLGVVLKEVGVSNSSLKYSDLISKNDIGCLTVIYDHSEIGPVYFPELKRKQDYALWLLILKKGYLAVPIKYCLASYNKPVNSLKRGKLVLFIEHYNFLTKYEKISAFKSFYFTVKWVFNGLVKYYT